MEVRRRDRPFEFELDLPATHSAVRRGRQLTREFALSEGLPPAEVQTLEFVTGELLDNAVDHGGGGGAREEADLPGDIRMGLLLQLGEGEWALTVSDQGGGSPEPIRLLLEPPDGVPDLGDERGRGFFLLRGLVDEITVARTPDGAGLAIRASNGYGT